MRGRVKMEQEGKAGIGGWKFREVDGQSVSDRSAGLKKKVNCGGVVISGRIDTWEPSGLKAL